MVFIRMVRYQMVILMLLHQQHPAQVAERVTQHSPPNELNFFVSFIGSPTALLTNVCFVPFLIALFGLLCLG